MLVDPLSATVAVLFAKSVEALEGVDEHPNDSDSPLAVARRIDNLMGRDPALRSELSSIVDEAERHPTVGQFVVEIQGNARVGQVINIGEARDISF